MRLGLINNLLVVAMVSLLTACGSGESHQDLRDYIAETKRRPAGQIDPLPPFVPYKSFSYGALTLRSPFDPPVEEEVQLILQSGSNIKPDLSREKEFLEGFNLASLLMVGSLKKGGVHWVLVKDSDGGIHRVTTGDYLGKNHGKIVATTDRNMDIVEIVPNGSDGWVERPKVLQLVEKD